MPLPENRFTCFCCALLIWVLTFTLPTSANSLPEQLTLTYQAFAGNNKIGTLTKVLLKTGDTWTSESDTKVNLLLSLLAGKMTETSSFQIIDNHIQSISYSEKRTGIKPMDNEVSFDWKNKIVSFNNGNQQSIPESYTVDAGSLVYAFILMENGLLKDDRLNIVSGDEIRQFRRQKTVQEKIDSPMGQLETHRIDLLRIDKEDRTWTIWVDINKRIPVKIRKQRKDEISTMLIESIVGL
jgi:predicted MPP superfamily phosphohydrolase